MSANEHAYYERVQLENEERQLALRLASGFHARKGPTRKRHKPHRRGRNK